MLRARRHNKSCARTKLPWYAEGLRFSCLRCGDCCRGEPGFVWVTTAEIEAAAQFLNVPPERFKGDYVRSVHGRFSLMELPDGDCVFWSPTGCRIYPVRPTQCRTFPFWAEYLRSPSAWSAVQRRCPGVGIGKVRTLEEIGAALRSRTDA